MYSEEASGLINILKMEKKGRTQKLVTLNLGVLHHKYPPSFILTPPLINYI